MARPITWQDVAAPSQGAALIAAAQAGRTITDSLAGIGQVGTDFTNQIKADNTKAAVADIMASADPAAAAAAAPRGWAVDPLALAAAAQSRDSTLRQNAAADASLAASKVSTAANQAQLDDRVAEREASTMSSPMIDNILKSGKLPSIDLNAPEWKTAAGNRAYKQVLDFWGQFQDDKRSAESLHWQRKAVIDKEATEDFLGWSREFGASPEGQKLDPAEMDRRLTAEAKRRGVSAVYVGDGSKMFEQGATANRPTDAELGSRVPGMDTTYRETNNILSAAQQDLTAQRAAAVSQFDRAVRGQELAAGTVFSGPSQGIPAQLAKSANMDLDEAQDRINRIRSKYPNITDPQAADIAMATQDRWNTWINNPASAPEAVAMAEAYAEFNKIGGTTGLADKLNSAAAPFDKELAKLPVLSRQISGAARTGDALPEGANAIVTSFRDAQNRQTQAQAAEAQKAIDDAAAAAKRRDNVRNASPGTPWQN